MRIAHIVNVASHAVSQVAAQIVGTGAVVDMVEALLDDLTPEHIEFHIENSNSLWDMVPEEMKQTMRQMAAPYREGIKDFPEEGIATIVNQLRPDLASVIMSSERGQAWLSGIFHQIRLDLLGEGNGSDSTGD